MNFLPNHSFDEIHQLYDETINLMDQKYPGYGYDHLDQNTKRDYPVAYAFYALAEGRRYILTRNIKAYENMLNAASWLIEHADLDEDGELGWGVPVNRNTFRVSDFDTTHLEYAVPTSFACQALLETHLLTSKLGDFDIASNCRDTAIGATTTFYKGCYSETESGICFWYSASRKHNFHVINASALLLGQFQHISQYVIDGEKFSKIANSALQFLLQLKRTKGNESWFYFGTHKPPSRLNNRIHDILHDAYTYHGILEYKKYDGQYSHLFNENQFLENIHAFIKEGVLYEYPYGSWNSRNMERRKKWARLWGIAHALYISAYIENNFLLDKSDQNEYRLFNYSFSSYLYSLLIKNYHFQNYWLNQPEDITNKSGVRATAHVLLALSMYMTFIEKQRYLRVNLTT